MNNIRNIINWNDSYYKINREERNLAAIFYHILLINNNLEIFLENISCDFSIVQEELGLYFEYAYLRDLWFNINGRNDLKRDIIYKFLNPSNIDELKQMSTYEFNKFFGAVPSASKEHIQSPANWSIKRYKNNIKNDEEFLRTCKFKWAFNAKPDIVIHTSNDTAICIECKYESGEGHYPSTSNEIKEFKKRNLKPVTQTSLQKYLMEDLLGIQTQFLYLVQKQKTSSSTHKTLLWKDAFSKLDLDNCPLFIKEWVRRI